MWARVIGHTASYDQYATITYPVTPPALTAVSLSAAPASPQSINTPITLTAIPTPASVSGQVQYMFRVGYVDGAGWHWTNLNANYTTTPIITWTPTVANNYTLVVWARTVGHTDNYDQYVALSYQVTTP